MARVVIYERAVDAVLTDVTFYDKLNRSQNGTKIKEEPLDPDISKPDDSSSVSNATEAVRRRSSPLDDDHLSNSFNDKENKSAPAKEHAEPKTNRSNPDREKCKRSTPKKKRVGNSQPPKKHRSHKRCSLDAADYKRRRRLTAMVECDVCSLSFRTQRTLKRHKASHNISNKYSCDVCMSEFTSTTTLLRHKEFCARSQQPDNGSTCYCYFCKRKFTTKKPLQAHLFHAHRNTILSPEIDVDKTQPNTDPTPTINSLVANVHTEQAPEKSKDNPSSPPGKKMRQTTLTEFLSLFGKHNDKKQKQECVSPRKSCVATNQGQALRNNADPLTSDEATTAKATKSSALAAPTANQSATSKRPFVQIHVDTNMMMSLLNIKIKSEPKDFCTPNRSHNSSYNLRQPRTDSTRLSFEQREESSHLQRKRRRTTQSYQRDIALWDRQMRAKFGCRECVVRLERCDLTLNSEKETNEPQTIPLKEGALNAEGNCETGRRRSVGNLFAGNLEASLVWTNKDATKSAVKKPEISTKGTHELKESNKENEHKAFRCKICKKSFSSKENIREHMELFHVAYISSVCSAGYTSISKLLNHYLRQHGVLKRKQCCVCYEKFDTRMSLKQHMSLHCIKVTRSKNDNLPIDGKTVCSVFKKHYQCRGCSKRFWLKSCLQQHQKVCHRAKEMRKDAASPSMNCVEDTVKSSDAHVRCDSEVSGRRSSDCSKQTRDKTIISNNVVQQESYGNSDSSIPGGCSASTPQSKASQPRKGANHRMLVNGVACVKGYQIDVVGTGKVKFPCSVCEKQFQTFQNLCIHERTFCKPSDNQCSVCGTSFTTKRLLQQHMLATHTPMCNEGYKFFCKFCNQGFNKRANLLMHERHFHTNQSPANPSAWWHNEHARNVNTVCIVCNLKFESYERFIQHNMYYYKGQIFTCMFCNQSFQGLYVLHHHSKLMHYPEDTRSVYAYSCDICNEGFNQESHFHAHKLHVHLHETSSAQNSLRIIQGQTYQDHSYALIANNVTITEATTMRVPIMAYTCEVCSLSFTNRRDLSSHEMEYSNEGDFHCSKCDKWFSNAAVLTKHHSLNHSGHDVSNCYKCRSCGEVLTTNTAMVCHEKHFHTANNDDQRSRCNASDLLDAKQNTCRKTVNQTNNITGNLTCLTCAMRFENEMKLKDHLLEYSDIGDYQCEVCHRKFAEVHRLEVHKLKHSRLNNIFNEHHCPICHEGFSSAANVPIHVRHLHGYETFPSVAIKRSYIHEIGSAKVIQTNENCERVNADCNDGRMCNSTQFDAVRKISSNTEEEQSTHVPLMPTDLTKPSNASVSPSVNETQVQGVKCPECGLAFNNYITLTKHRSRFANYGEYACVHCGRHFDKYKALNAHLPIHFIDVQLRFSKYECSYCSEKFRTPISVYSHVVHIHGKDKLMGKCIVTNRSGISNVALEYSKVCGNDALMRKVFSNDDLEIDHAHESITENVDAWNHSGQQEISSSTATNSVNDTLKSTKKTPETVNSPVNSEKGTPKSVNKPLNSLNKQSKLVIEPLNIVIKVPNSAKKVSNSVQERRDSVKFEDKSLSYTCPVCSQKYPTRKKFQTHFEVSHGDMIHETIGAPQQFANLNTVDCMMCNSIFCNESEFHEHIESSHAPTRQAVPRQLISSSSLVSRDAVEIVSGKNSTITRSIESLNFQDPVMSMNQLESLPPATIATVQNKVGRLKVKSFARMMN